MGALVGITCGAIAAAGGVSSALASAGAAIKTAAVTVGAAVKTAAAAVTTAAVTAGSYIASQGQRVVEGARNVVQRAGQAISDAAGKVSDVIQKAVTSGRVYQAGDVTPKGWKLTIHSAEQLSSGGRFDGQLALRAVDKLINSPNAINVYDTLTTNLNRFVNSNLSSRSLVRITMPSDGAQRLISIGYQSLKDINKYIEKGRYISLP